jgi:hypothetical protein
MSRRLAKLQEEKLEKLKMLSSARRVQLEEALAPEPAPISPSPLGIVSAEEPEAAAVFRLAAQLETAQPWANRRPAQTF